MSYLKGDEMFEIGDKVQYVREGKIGWELRDWAKNSGLHLMGIYEVGFFDCDHPLPVVRIKGDKCYNIHPDHFILIQRKGENNEQEL